MNICEKNVKKIKSVKKGRICLGVIENEVSNGGSGSKPKSGHVKKPLGCLKARGLQTSSLKTKNPSRSKLSNKSKNNSPKKPHFLAKVDSSTTWGTSLPWTTPLNLQFSLLFHNFPRIRPQTNFLSFLIMLSTRGLLFGSFLLTFACSTRVSWKYLTKKRLQRRTSQIEVWTDTEKREFFTRQEWILIWVCLKTIKKQPLVSSSTPASNGQSLEQVKLVEPRTAPLFWTSEQRWHSFLSTCFCFYVWN